MEPIIVKAESLKEFYRNEGCYISESWGATQDDKLSIARATVKPSVTTAAHRLEGIQEIYLIITGIGMVYVGTLQPAKVVEGDVVVIPPGTSQKIANIGNTNLVFYCICTPAFTENSYHSEE